MARATQNALKHGGARKGAVEPLHKVWRKMWSRCICRTDAAYADYGGRGIAVCDDWADYATFRDWAQANGYEAGLTIERKDNDGDYSPANCRWATRKEQARNRRSTRLVTINGRTACAAQWLEETGVTQSAFYCRLARGWSEARALGFSF